MALHPTVIDPDPNQEGRYDVPPNTLFSLTIEFDGSPLRVLVAHTAGLTNQDHSLRCWISETPGGPPINDHPHYMRTWHANRNYEEYVTLYSDTPDGLRYPILAQAGVYYANVLNLTQKTNQFLMDLTPEP